MMSSYIVLAVVAVLGIYLVATYNGFVNAINRAKEAWADIDVQLKRRWDLIPNLVETVKGYAAHEGSVFEGVTKARAAAMSATGVQGHAEAENMLAGALKSVFAIAEAYPELKANENFLELQRELSDTENKLQAARRFYNSTVMTLKNMLEQFPSNIVGSIGGFKGMDFFELSADEAAAKNPVKVSF